MFNENLLNSASEQRDVLTQDGRRVDQIGVDVRSQLVGAAKTDDRPTTLSHLTENDSKVGDGVLDGLLQFAQVTSGVLKTYKKTRLVKSSFDTCITLKN